MTLILAMIFGNMTPKAQAPKARINKSESTMRSFGTVRQSVSKAKRQPPGWENVAVTHTPDKGLLSKTYKALMQLKRKKKGRGHE